MRGGFGRGRMEKPQPGVVVNSYEEALYPPRPFRYHVQQQTFPPQQLGQRQRPPAVVLPSIDADTTCEPHANAMQTGAFVGGSGGGMGGTTAAAGLAQTVEKKPAPALREFFSCYAPLSSASAKPDGSPEQASEDDGLEEFCVLAKYAQFEGKASGWVEPLNIFHYPQLFALPTFPPSIAGGARETLDEGHVRQAATMLADALELPLELRTFTAPVSNPVSGALRLTARTEARLRIRTAARHRAARVLRRGAKVAIIASAQPAPGFSGHHSSRQLAPIQGHGKRPRPDAVADFLNDDDEESHHHHKRAKREDDGIGGGGGGDYEKTHNSGGNNNDNNNGDGWNEHEGDAEDNEDDDELSVDLYDAADDDDQADVDDMGGDDDGGDNF